MRRNHKRKMLTKKRSYFIINSLRNISRLNIFQKFSRKLYKTQIKFILWKSSKIHNILLIIIINRHNESKQQIKDKHLIAHDLL